MLFRLLVQFSWTITYMQSVYAIIKITIGIPFAPHASLENYTLSLGYACIFCVFRTKTTITYRSKHAPFDTIFYKQS